MFPGPSSTVAILCDDHVPIGHEHNTGNTSNISAAPKAVLHLSAEPECNIERDPLSTHIGLPVLFQVTAAQALVQDAVLKWKKSYSAGVDSGRREVSEQHVFNEEGGHPKPASENVHLLASQPLFSDYVPARDANPSALPGRNSAQDRRHVA